MAALMTFDSLSADLAEYCERTNNAVFLTQVPKLINLAENRIAADLKQQGFQTVVTGQFRAVDFTSPVNVLAKPRWWRETISFSWYDDTPDPTTQVPYGNRPLLLRSLEYVKNYWTNPAQTGSPRFYADYNAKMFLIAPSPAAVGGVGPNFELVYYARLEPLDLTNQVNWLTENAPQALLFAAMEESHMFLKNYAAAATWKGRYDEQKSSLLGENSERLADRSEVVVRG